MRHNLSASVIASIVALAGLALGSLLGPLLVPAGPNVGEIAERLQPPLIVSSLTGTHLLGTDHLGRDMLVRVLYAGRVSLSIGILAVLLSGTIGVGIGLLAGYLGGPLDRGFMRLSDVQLAMPSLALAILVVAVLGPGFVNVIAVLGVAGWVLYFRVIRASVLTVRELEFVTSARAIGAHPTRIVLRTILPNVLPSAVVIASLAVSQMIIAESSLSFIGIGMPPATPSWGTMLADARNYLPVAWWMPTIPGLAITTTVLSINIIGDWLRDLLDPRLRLPR